MPQRVLRQVRGKLIVMEPPALRMDPAVLVSFGLGLDAKFSLHTRDHEVAKARQGFAAAHIQKIYSAAEDGPRPLSHKELVALSGEVYRLRVNRFQDNPVAPQLGQPSKPSKARCHGLGYPHILASDCALLGCARCGPAISPPRK